MPGEINGNNAVGEASDHSGFCIGPTLLNREVYYSMLVYSALKELCSQLKLSEARNVPYADKARSEKEVIDYYILPLLERLEEIIKNLSSESSTIVRFCRPIIEKLSVFARNSDVKITTDFQPENLKKKVWFLKELKEKNNFASVQKAYRDKWSLYGLMNDGDFKQTYVDKAVGELDESVSKSFREGINKYVKSVDEGKKVASRHFEKNIAFQAYCEETDNADKTLNVNLINYNGSEPIKISDILQQEKDIGKLNIYCNKKHDIFARREDKKRYYEFKEGAYYQMTSKWPIKDESGRVVLTCTMVMDVSSEGITEITEFSGEVPNGGNCTLSPEEYMELIERNEELHIQGSPLHKAVKKFLEMQRNREEVIRKGEDGKRDSSLPDVVPGGNIGVSEVHEEQPDLGKSNENMGRNTGNQPRYITKISLVPGTDTPPIYKTTVYVTIENNSQNEESNNDVQKCIISDPIKDLEAVRKQLRELRIELTTLEEKLKQERYLINKNSWPASDLKSRIASVENLVRVNKDLDNRYDELQGICEKLGELKEFICEVKERSKDQNIWHANDLSSLSNLCNFTNLLNMDIIKLQKVIEVLQLQFRENLYRNDVKELIKSDPELIEGIGGISYDIGYDGDDEVSNCSVPQCRWLFRTLGR